MERKEDSARYYNALIWLVLTEYDKDIGYSPSDYIIQTTKPTLEISAGGLPIEIVDSTLFDFTIAKGVKDFMDLFLDTSSKFDSSLIILSYIKDKYIVRDAYLAALAKEYTCWDTAYIACPDPKKVTTTAFDFLVTPKELPNKLTKIIKGNK